MALRVLLADESTTIKKVMQLALQDFAVEVKAVHAGIDVLDVARSFQPDVIFADVLLQKKNGYEVCSLLKADASLKSVPVILMWSSFMDLDENLAKSSGAEGRLEKPFDVETLRKLVLDLVPKTRTQRLAHFLEFPEGPAAELKAEEVGKAKPAAPQSAAPATPGYREPQVVEKPKAPPVYQPPPVEAAPVEQAPQVPRKGWSMESFEDPSVFAEELEAESAPTSPAHGNLPVDDDEDESFKPLELSNFESGDSSPSLNLDSDTNPDFRSGDDEDWSHQDLSRFKLDLPPVTVQSDEGPDADLRIDMGEDQLTNPGFDRTEPVIPMPTPQMALPQPTSSRASASTPPPALERAPAFGDLQSDFQVEYENSGEIELPETDLTLDQAEEELSLEGSTLDAGKIPPKLSADRLEEIIRAQSRDIIESVVRKIVPDLATAIIREELERLLEDTAIREARGRKGPSL